MDTQTRSPLLTFEAYLRQLLAAPQPPAPTHDKRPPRILPDTPTDN
jgi:hypothetical protein